MKKLFIAASPMILSTVALGQAGTPCSYVMKTVISRDNNKFTEESKFFIGAPSKFRIEQTVSGKNAVTIANGTNLYKFDPVSKIGQHGTTTAQAIMAMGKGVTLTSDFLEQFKKKGAKKSGTAVVAGVPCDKFTLKQGEIENSLFVEQGASKRLRRIIQAGTVHAADKMGAPMMTHVLRTETDILNFQTGKPLPESLFKAPTDVRFTEAQTGPAKPNMPTADNAKQIVPPTGKK